VHYIPPSFTGKGISPLIQNGDGVKNKTINEIRNNREL
jgi:hypothetical protein